MAQKSKEPSEPKRLNRAVGLDEALKGVLDSALKKRGFATRDLITHWATMAPRPYDQVAVPAALKWPRGAGHEGATLYLRCKPGHALGLAHEGAKVAAAENRNYGYLLVREVRLSAEPFTEGTAAKPADRLRPPASPEAGAAVAEVGDPALKTALRTLGGQILANRAR